VATPYARIKLELRPISRLRPHEETVGRLSEGLLRRLLRDGVQRDPVVVDGASDTILDGTHRVDALGKAGAELALTHVVDYRGPQVVLYRWYRVISDPGEKRAKEILSELRLEKRGPLDEADFQPRPRSGLLVAYHGEVFVIEKEDREGQTSTMRSFDRAAAGKGLHLGFIDEATATPSLVQGEDLTLIPPGFCKEDVLRAAADGRLLPPKSTLHVFPVRPMGVDYPIEALRTGRNILDEVLRARTTRTIEPRSAYGGRGYRERVVVFE